MGVGNHSGMYSTRRIHKNAGTDFLFVGQKNATDRKFKPQGRDFAHRSKQFQTKPTPKLVGARAAYDNFFSNPAYKSEPFKERQPYIKMFPPEKRRAGFGSRDAPKRDEFHNRNRELQYKELINREQRINLRHMEKAAENAGREIEKNPALARTGPNTPPEQAARRSTLARSALQATAFDKLYGNSDSSKDNKFHRDTAQCRIIDDMRKYGKRTGSSRPSSMEYGYNCHTVEKPQFGTVSLIKDFHDINHLHTGLA